MKKIEGVNFEWNDHANITEGKNIEVPLAFVGPHVGVIAQQIEDIVPEIVWTDEDGYKSVEYGLMVSLGIGAVQEQQKRIDSIKSRIKFLKDKISG